ncbi:MAG TPA: hypothetical protein PK514_12945 [Spirochaetota bacterium]|nr:hypothetical protein [Spirochaetota bacterium]
MNTRRVSHGFALIMILCTTAAFSAGIYENANQSAEFIRTLTRYASTETDSAFYNPAGSVFMSEGFYLYFSDQMVFDYQTITDSSTALSTYSYPAEYTADVIAWALPDVYALYRQDNWSAFLHLGIIGRGAIAEYKDSTPIIDKAVIGYAAGLASGMLGTLYSISTDGELEAYSYFIGATAGGAYRLNNMFAIGGGIRYIHAEQKTNLKYHFNSVMMDVTTDITSFFSDIDVEVNARGDSAGFIGSFDVKPSDTMNIGFRYEYYTTMKVTNDKPGKYEGDPLFLAMFPLDKGDYVKTTLPMNAAAGVSYMVLPELKAEIGFIYYFNRLADWGKDSYGKEIADKYDNGYDASISLEYMFMKQLRGSMGYSYSVSGVTSETRTNDQTGLDSNAFAAGGTWTFANGMDLTVSLLMVFFDDATEPNSSPDTGSTKYEELVYNVAAGISYKMW